MQTKFLRPKDAAKKAGISISHLYNLIARNDFPIPIKISKGITVFLESDIDDWILQKVDNSRSNYLI
ncbi:AlpA family phage regulatory protein [Pseudomonadales bacterium]|nr:AlpA family phage regulatory protein [Pseudomonadales bacterium]